MRYKLLLMGIVFFAFALRVVGIAKYPAGFSADEVNQGYTAYSILKTGKDEWGEKFPLAPRSYGDYRAPFYTYLTIPSIAIFGLTELAVRLPNALVATSAVLVVYFFALELLKSRKVALFSTFLLAISPWHIMLSRGAFEPALPVFLIPLGWLAFLKGRQNRLWMATSGVVFGLSLFSYYSARFLVPFLVFGLIWHSYRKLKKLRWELIISFALFVLLAAYTMFFGAGTRSSDVAITSPTHGWGAVSDMRFEAILLGLPDFVSRAFNNKLAYTLSEFIRSYLSYFSPQFLFTNGAGEATYGMFPGQGLLYLIEIVFLGGFVVMLVRNFKSFPKLILFWLILAPIPAALAKGPGLAANRVALAMPFVQIISAVGAVFLFDKFKSQRRNLVAMCSIVFLISFSFFLQRYYFQAPAANAKSMSYGWKQIMDYVNENDHYSRIIVSRKFSEPQMFVAFYGKFEPTVVQQDSNDWLRYENEGLKFVDQLGEYGLGKFQFRQINYSVDGTLPNALLIGKVDDFPEKVGWVKRIDYPDGKPAILLVESSQSFAHK